MTTTIWLLLLSLPVLSQAYPATADPATLSKQLTATCNTDKEKVKAIFNWITTNIAYSRVEVRDNKRKSRKTTVIADNSDDGQALPSLSDRIAARVIADRAAVCEGYARLFKSLCDHAGLNAAIITGFARSDVGRAEARFRSNHAWNAVYFDSAWHLLDATWASGYIAMPSGEFVHHYDEYFFLTPPEKFVRHHYPDDPRWTLLADPPVLNEFRQTPFRPRSFNKYFITSFFPAEGIIDAYLGDTLRFEIKLAGGRSGIEIAPDSLWDSSSLAPAPIYAYVQPEMPKNGATISYSFTVSSTEVQWLHVMYNNDAVLRYRLNIKQPRGQIQ